MQLIADTRDGVYNQNNKLLCFDEKTALGWLSKLDGKQHTLLSLERDDGWQLMVGGGPFRYIITLGNGVENLTFQNADGDDAIVVKLCAGGQFGEFPQTLCATHQQATQVILSFFIKKEQQESWV